MTAELKLSSPRGPCRKGKRSALVEHGRRSAPHAELVGEVRRSLHSVPLVGGLAHRLAGRIAIVTGAAATAAVSEWWVVTRAQRTLHAAASVLLHQTRDAAGAAYRSATNLYSTGMPPLCV